MEKSLQPSCIYCNKYDINKHFSKSLQIFFTLINKINDAEIKTLCSLIMNKIKCTAFNFKTFLYLLQNKNIRHFNFIVNLSIPSQTADDMIKVLFVS